MPSLAERCLTCNRDTVPLSGRHIRITTQSGKVYEGHVCYQCAWVLGLGYRKWVWTGLRIATGIGLGLWAGQAIWLVWEWLQKH